MLLKKCFKTDFNCAKSRLTLIGVLGQVKSPQAQMVLVNDVIMRDPAEEEMKAAIFHLGTQNKATKVKA